MNVKSIQRDAETEVKISQILLLSRKFLIRLILAYPERTEDGIARASAFSTKSSQWYFCQW